MKTNELTELALDGTVAKCEGDIWEGDWYARHTCRFKRSAFGVCLASGETFSPSTEWAYGGPIIEREGIDLTHICPGTWRANLAGHWFNGPTPLIAAMRCYVASKLGDDVEIPDELI